MSIKSLYLTLVVLAGDVQANYVMPAKQGPLDIMNSMLDFISDSLKYMTFLAGVGLVGVALYNYMRHRENPLEVPISKPITFLILGCILMVVQYIPMSEV